VNNVKLTDEHIVPYSLGGQHVLLDASCAACCGITKKFEQEVARGLWGDARTSYGAPSRRKKHRKSHIVVRDPKNPERGIRVPYSEYPAPMVFYKMSKAGILQGASEEADLSFMWKLVTVTDEKRLKAFEAKYPGKLTASFKHVPESFGRLIAKVGYGQVLTLLSPREFNPICLPYILGQRFNISYVVGGASEIPPPNKETGYDLRTGGFGDSQRLVLLSEVRLVANDRTPVYHVVVGDIIGRENIEHVLVRLKGQIEILPIDSPVKDGSWGDHWRPNMWPLPYFALKAA
jgi:hypothetical protein